jgi:hypothetical protein
MRFMPILMPAIHSLRVATVFHVTSAKVAALLGLTIVWAAQGASAEQVAYCDELKELNNYAMSRERFAPIIGQPRSGNYRETSLPLTGWMNCAFYGTNSYTCDSPELPSRDEAIKTQQ